MNRIRTGIVFGILALIVCTGGNARAELPVWAIGTCDGTPLAEDSATEFPATGSWVESFVYDFTEGGDPYASPEMPGFLGNTNVCNLIFDGRPCTDSTAELSIEFWLDVDYPAGYFIFRYDRYGSERDDILLDGALIGQVSSAEETLGQYSFQLPAMAAGPHRIGLRYVGGGIANGHYIDCLRLNAFGPVPVGGLLSWGMVKSSWLN